MTFGQLFNVMNPEVVVRKNGTCIWLYFDDVNYYTIGAEWWDKDIPDNAITVLEEHKGRRSGMTDREKVIKTIEICYSEKHNCTECELFYVEDCNHKLMRDVLELLKEQEPVKPIVESALVDGFKVYSCGHCQTVFLLWRQKYCANCGKAVKWHET